MLPFARRRALALVTAGILGCCGATLAGERAKAALEEGTTVTLVNMPLKDSLEYFSDAHKVTIVIAEILLPQDIPISGVFHGQKLREAFEFLLKPLNLTYRADGDRIVIK